MNKPLPDGWIEPTLGEICTHPQYGFTTRAMKAESGLKFLRITDLRANGVNWDDVPYCEDLPDDIDKYLIHDGDIVIARSGSVGKAYLVVRPRRAVFASYLIRFRPIEVAEKYVAFFLQSPEYWQQIADVSTGNTIYNVNAQKMAQLRIPIAPLNEQRRIVTAIEEQFSRLDAGGEALKRLQANLKRYKAAVLKAACEGKLVPPSPDDESASELLVRILRERRVKWEADQRAKGKDPRKLTYPEPAAPDTDGLPDLPEGWVWATIDQLSYFITSGSRGWAKYYSDEGSLFVRVGNFERLTTKLELTKTQFVNPPRGAEGERTRLELGDLLITVTADVGMVGVADDNVFRWGEAFINQHVGLVRLVDITIAAYLAYAIASETVQAQVRELRYGATKVGLGLNDLKVLSLPVPPYRVLLQVVDELERQITSVESLEVQVDFSQKRADRLRQSILREAFSGRLVPQDPNDEPASELLKRIWQKQAEKASSKVKQDDQLSYL